MICPIPLKVDSELDRDQKLWRYIDLAKFVNMIENQKLWLARADTFDDQREGFFPDEMMTIMKSLYEKFQKESNQESAVRDANDFQDYLRRNTFISCWHINNDENMAMWALYGNRTTGLAIQTTVGLLEKNIKQMNIEPVTELERENRYRSKPHSFHFKKVRYKHAEDVKGQLDYSKPFFIKRPHFAHEQEARICLNNYSATNPTKDTPKGYKLNININELIETIIIHPDSPDWFMGVIKSIVNKYDVHASVERGVCGNK